MSKIHPNTLPRKTADLVNILQTNLPDFLGKFYLSGGTALSLQLGHRESEDLDFFSQKSFDPQKIQQQLAEYGSLQQAELDEGTLNTFLCGVKLQFLEYPYKLLQKTITWKKIQLSSVLDIACTKLHTISTRGSKKDFIDLYFILQNRSLASLFQSTRLKYPMVNYNQTHILKSLVYFENADQQPMPRMHIEIDWDEVKESLIKVVKQIQI